MPNLSQKSIRDVIQAADGPVSKTALKKALTEAEVTFNDALLDGYIEQACEKWLAVDDKGKYSIVKKASSGGGGAPTKLFKVDDPMNPAGSEILEFEYDAALEEKDDLVRRTVGAAIKAAKAQWYNVEYWPKLEAYRQMEFDAMPEERQKAVLEARAAKEAEKAAAA